jgi:hypothetical protein
MKSLCSTQKHGLYTAGFIGTPRPHEMPCKQLKKNGIDGYLQGRFVA